MKKKNQEKLPVRLMPTVNAKQKTPFQESLSSYYTYFASEAVASAPPTFPQFGQA